MLRKIFYGFGGLSYSIISQTISNFFMFFATSVLGLSGTLVGISIAISTVWDGISDTIIGYVSDRFPIGRLGKRNGYMIIATFGMAIFNYALWTIPIGLSTTLKFVWIIVSQLLLETFNTMFATPYSALGNELSSSYHERTKINAYYIVFYLIGIIIPSVLLVIFLPSTAEYPIGQLNPAGYKNIAIVTSIICLVFGLSCSIFTLKSTKVRDTRVVHEKFSIGDIFKNFLATFKQGKTSKIIWGYVLTSVATVFLCSVGLHFFTYSFFYESTQITFLLLTLIVGTILSQPLWVFISKKKRKKPALVMGILATILSVFGIILIYLFRIELYSVSYILMLILIFCCGVGSGALYSLPLSLYGDAVAEVSGKNDSLNATYFGSLTFAGNIANSITQLLVGVLLDIIHFDSAKQVQTLSVQTGLALILFVGVQCALILSCWIFASVKEKNEKNV